MARDRERLRPWMQPLSTPGPNDLVYGVTQVRVAELLLAKLGSGVVTRTPAEAYNQPEIVGVTVTLNVAPVPGAKFPALQFTTTPDRTQPWDAETKVTPGGRVRVRMVLAAVSSPRLTPTMV